jgi:hypothetical protein
MLNEIQKTHAIARCRQNGASPESMSRYHPFIRQLAYECGAHGPTDEVEVFGFLKRERKAGRLGGFPRSRNVPLPERVRRAILKHFGKHLGRADTLTENLAFMEPLFRDLQAFNRDTIARWCISVRKQQSRSKT